MVQISSGGSKTWRKLVSVTWVVGVNFFRGVFGLCLFQANLPLNMLVTLDSNFFHENLLEKTKSAAEYAGIFLGGEEAPLLPY